MRFLRDLPIKRKLTVITTLISGVALLLASVAFMAYEQFAFRRAMAQDMSVLTDLFDDNVASGLEFNDPKSIEVTLKALDAHAHIVAAAVYDRSGQVAAKYQRADLKSPFSFPAAQETGVHFQKDRLDAFRKVMLAGEEVGTIYIGSDLRELSRSFCSPHRWWPSLWPPDCSGSFQTRFFISLRPPARWPRRRTIQSAPSNRARTIWAG